MSRLNLALLSLAGAGSLTALFAIATFDWLAWTCRLPNPTSEPSRPFALGPGGCVEFWLYRYQTLIGGLIALLAAFGAWRGVSRQILTSQEQVDQMKAQLPLMKQQSAMAIRKELSEYLTSLRRFNSALHSALMQFEKAEMYFQSFLTACRYEQYPIYGENRDTISPEMKCILSEKYADLKPEIDIVVTLLSEMNESFAKLQLGSISETAYFEFTNIRLACEGHIMRFSRCTSIMDMINRGAGLQIIQNTCSRIHYFGNVRRVDPLHGYEFVALEGVIAKQLRMAFEEILSMN